MDRTEWVATASRGSHGSRGARGAWFVLVAAGAALTACTAEAPDGVAPDGLAPDGVATMAPGLVGNVQVSSADSTAFVVTLGDAAGPFCNGLLISGHHVLTTKHCAEDNGVPHDVVVRFRAGLGAAETVPAAAIRISPADEGGDVCTGEADLELALLQLAHGRAVPVLPRLGAGGCGVGDVVQVHSAKASGSWAEPFDHTYVADVTVDDVRPESCGLLEAAYSYALTVTEGGDSGSAVVRHLDSCAPPMRPDGPQLCGLLVGVHNSGAFDGIASRVDTPRALQWISDNL